MSSPRAWLFGVALAMLLACPSGASAPRFSGVVEASGLPVPRPEGFDLVSADPKVVLLQAAELRTPLQLEVWREDVLDRDPKARSRVVAGQATHYRTTQVTEVRGGDVRAAPAPTCPGRACGPRGEPSIRS